MIFGQRWSVRNGDQRYRRRGYQPQSPAKTILEPHTDSQVFGMLVHLSFDIRRNSTCALIEYSEVWQVVEESCQSHLWKIKR